MMQKWAKFAGADTLRASVSVQFQALTMDNNFLYVCPFSFQADSIFNLKSPYDLVTFIHQQSAYDRLKILREEYLEEKRKVIEARERERAEIQQTFYKEDPDCVDAGKHISEFKLYLDMTNPFTTNDIK